MNEIANFAERELAKLNPNDDDEMQAAINNQIMDIINVFSQQGHSGTTGPYAANVAAKLMIFQPLTPLQGTDDEWMYVAEQNGPLYQNIRCSHVFKDDKGAYDIDGYVFEDQYGAYYTDKDSLKWIEFPYTPERQYIYKPVEDE